MEGGPYSPQGQGPARIHTSTRPPSPYPATSPRSPSSPSSFHPDEVLDQSDAIVGSSSNSSGSGVPMTTPSPSSPPPSFPPPSPPPTFLVQTNVTACHSHLAGARLMKYERATGAGSWRGTILRAAKAAAVEEEVMAVALGGGRRRGQGLGEKRTSHKVSVCLCVYAEPKINRWPHWPFSMHFSTKISNRTHSNTTQSCIQMANQIIIQT